MTVSHPADPPIPGHDDFPDYDVCLPMHLRPDARRLINYLHELPHRPVRFCPWCDATDLRFRSQPARQRLARYYCRSCRKSCNSLSDSPFANLHRMDQWAAFAVYLLAGWSSVQIAARFGLTSKVYFSWGRAVGVVMAEECAELHQWWTTRQFRENLQPPEHIERQQRAVVTWLETTLNARHARCPTCGGGRTYRIKGLRPKFKCDPCVTCFCTLSATPLTGMIRADLWVDFIKGVMDGQSIQDLKRSSGLGMGASKRWREQFLLLIEALGHSELLGWIVWMRSRRSNEVVSLVRQGGCLDMATRSVYPQGLRKGRFVSKQ